MKKTKCKNHCRVIKLEPVRYNVKATTVHLNVSNKEYTSYITKHSMCIYAYCFEANDCCSCKDGIDCFYILN